MLEAFAGRNGNGPPLTHLRTASGAITGTLVTLRTRDGSWKSGAP